MDDELELPNLSENLFKPFFAPFLSISEIKKKKKPLIQFQGFRFSGIKAKKLTRICRVSYYYSCSWNG